MSQAFGALRGIIKGALRLGKENIMKKISLLLAALALVMTGCAKTAAPDRERSEVKLLDGAEPERSALTFCTYYGDTTEELCLFDCEIEWEIVNKVNECAVYDAELSELDGLDGNMYSLDIGGSDGWSITLTWQDGFCVTESGEVYYTDMDDDFFAELTNGYEWKSSVNRDGNMLPNRYFFANRGEWDAKYLNKSAETVPEGIDVEVISVGDVITAKLTNTTDDDLMYGVGYSMQVLLGGDWYDVPPKEVVFTPAVGFTLPAGTSVEKTYGYSWYVDLPKGTYRLIVEGAAAEFEI